MSKLSASCVAILAAFVLVPRASGQGTCALPEPFPRCGEHEVTVGPRTTMTLAAGAYGAVRVRNRGVLILRDGEYDFCSLHVSRGGKLLFGAASTIRVAGDVGFGNATVVGPVENGTVSPCAVELVVGGRRVRIQRKAAVRLALCAPNASLHANHGASLVGTFVSQTERLHDATVAGCPATTTTSTTTTLPPAVCGNGTRELPEACDDGNGDPEDGCRPDCTPTPCPQGIVDPHAGCALGGDFCDVLPPTCPATGPCALTGEEIHAAIAHLADDAQEGRDNLTPASVRVQDYLIDRLRTFAVGGTADGGFRQPFAQGTNILARIPGSNPSESETVVIGAHYDHLGIRNGQVHNGATDNAGGTAAVLAIARALARLPVPLARPVLIALWDAEEDGLAGSRYYVTAPAVPIADTIAYVNLDIAGSSPVQGFRRETFAVGVDTSPAWNGLLDPIDGGDPLTLGRLSAIFGQNRSDYVPFMNARVPIVFFSDTTGGCYHTPGDDLATVHVGKALRTAWAAFRLSVALANGSARPAFTPAQPLPTFADAVTLRAAFARGLCNAAASGLTAEQIAQAEGWVADLDAIVSAGPGAFEPGDGVTVGLTALEAIDLLTSLPCQAN